MGGCQAGITCGDVSKRQVDGILHGHPAAVDVQAWKQDYEWMQMAMFLDEPPPFEQTLDGVRGFEEECNRE